MTHFHFNVLYMTMLMQETSILVRHGENTRVGVNTMTILNTHAFSSGIEEIFSNNNNKNWKKNSGK